MTASGEVGRSPNCAAHWQSIKPQGIWLNYWFGHCWLFRQQLVPGPSSALALFNCLRPSVQLLLARGMTASQLSVTQVTPESLWKAANPFSPCASLSWAQIWCCVHWPNLVSYTPPKSSLTGTKVPQIVSHDQNTNFPLHLSWTSTIYPSEALLNASIIALSVENLFWLKNGGGRLYIK